MHTCVFESADSKCLKWLKTRLVTPDDNATLIKIITIKVVTGSLHGLKLSSFTFNIHDTEQQHKNRTQYHGLPQVGLAYLMCISALQIMGLWSPN